MISVLGFISIIFLCLLLAIFHSSSIGFVLYELIYFLNPGSRWWADNLPYIKYSFYSVLFMVLLCLINYEKIRENKLFSIPQFKWIYLLFIAFALAYFQAINKELHLAATIDFLKLIITITIAYKLLDNNRCLNYIIWGYIAGCFYIGIYAFQFGRDSTGRLEGIGTVDAMNSNSLAAALVPSIIFCLYYFWQSSNYKFKLAFAVLGIFIFNAIVLINSRGAFLALICSITYFFIVLLFSKVQIKLQKTYSIILIVAGLSGSLYIADDAFLNRMQSISHERITPEKETGSTRVLFWLAALEMSKDHPLGVGYRGFENYAPIYIPENINTGKSRNRAVHSSWFEALTEAGYLGLLFLIALIISSFKALKKCKQVLKEEYNLYYKIVAIESALISYLIAMTFINRFRAEIFYWCILFTICAYNIYVNKRECEAK